jgi:5-methylcytosine-specific restriction protein A
MNTYLFTWNPKQWTWEDLALRANDSASGKIVAERWSCHANAKRIKKGDRAFLIRLGEEPKGIIASGWTTSDPQLGLHWNKEKAALGKIR